VPPDGNAAFNVAIRTAVVDMSARRVEFGIGSGIVWDSEADAEYEECLLKGSVIGRPPVRFDLIETLRWSPTDGFLLLQRHLDRLRDSAEYFDFRFDAAAVRDALNGAVAELRHPQRLRLLLRADGTPTVEHSPLPPTSPLQVALAGQPVDRSTVWLYHKTTHRHVYERARAEAPDSDDVILWNELREVTESTVANIVVEVDGRRVTPPISCGLLGGTFRADLLARGEIEEQVITVEALRAAPRIWLINSVHEWREAVLVRR
jgi:para-aminobenzoate synthetase/4-amino-4-deoxychorismate lyase